MQKKALDTIKIAVLAGGVGSEREVSLQSGQTIYAGLQAEGFNAVLSDITPDDLRILDDESIDLFFLALHGRFGEDGQLQKIMEDRGLCFTGSGSEASRKAFDKHLSKQVFQRAGLPTARHILVQPGDTERMLIHQLDGYDKRLVVKPVNEGSSVGVEICETVYETAARAILCLRTYGNCMIEEFVEGREITVGILNGEPLPIIEIRSNARFYDFHAKYIDETTEYKFDTIEDAELAGTIQRKAAACFNELGCRHLSRVDFILAADGTAYILEINTLPGFTSHSLLPMAARRVGIPTPQLCRRIAAAAWDDCPKW